MKKIFFVTFEVMFILLAFVLVIFTGMAIYSFSFLGAKLDISNITDNKLSISVYSKEGLPLEEENSFNGKTISIDLIPEVTKNAFISIEDKEFYNHNGINLSRISKAFLNNLGSFSLKEGASTITQQLIKNTHLTSDKTLTRKLNEIKLAVELEKKLSKDEILENYLNVIYFGSNCYGIESASEYYFSKPASQLSLGESATLAGIIKSPNYYSVISQKERATHRRNVVLNEMLKDGKISTMQYIAEKNRPLEINLSSRYKNKLNSYSQSSVDEACRILKMPERQVALGGYKIYTYQNLKNQLALEIILKNAEISSDYSFINIDAKTGGIKAYLGKSDYKILEHKRQIGSIAKPLFVYAPAINEDLLSPASLILDEALTIDNFSPKNVNGKYLGHISTRTALSKSINIPAVKTASYVGLNKINNYANKLHLPLDEKDMSYAISLGGMTYGYNLKDLTGAYSVFTNGGVYKKPTFIEYITNKDGDIIYKNTEISNPVFREDTAFLITDMLKTCAKSGTARKLGTLPYDVASKTGTVGTKKGNTDAYNISYTTDDLIGVWEGNMDNSFITTAGGNEPTALAKLYLENLYREQPPKNFEMPSSVTEAEIDLSELENNHQIVLANEYTPEKYRIKEVFSRFNMPRENITPLYFNKPILTGKVENGKAILSFNALNSLEYKLYKITKNGTTLLKTFSGESGNVTFVDTLNSFKQKSQYFVESNLLVAKTAPIKSDIVTLINMPSNEVFKEKWYI